MTQKVEEASEAVDFGVLFEGTELSDEIKDKIKLVFESALTEKVTSEVKTIQEEYEQKFEAQLDEVKSELTDQIDTFLNYAVEEWIAENKLAVEGGLRTEITEGFIEGLKTLFAENYIEVPEEKYELVSEMEESVAELKDALDEQIAKNMTLNNTVSKLIKESVIADVAKGLSVTEVEKLKSLSEAVDFESEQSFKEKIVTLKENYFPKPTVPASKHLNEGETTEPVKQPVISDARIKSYVDALGKMQF